MKIDTKVRIVATAASTGETSHLILEYIFTGSVIVLGPVMNHAITTSSNDIRKAKRPAETIDGPSCGSTTCQKTRHCEAPMITATFSSRSSMFSTPAEIVRMMKG